VPAQPTAIIEINNGAIFIGFKLFMTITPQCLVQHIRPIFIYL
jgi:hypothetical protein